MEPSRPLFVSSNILPLRYIYVYKVLNVFYARSGNYHLSESNYRNRFRNVKVFIPRPMNTFYKHSYAYVAPKLFNQLPEVVKLARSQVMFSVRLRKWLLSLDDVDCLLNAIDKQIISG
jgi:hypothetical protein